MVAWYWNEFMELNRVSTVYIFSECIKIINDKQIFRLWVGTYYLLFYFNCDNYESTTFTIFWLSNLFKEFLSTQRHNLNIFMSRLMSIGRYSRQPWEYHTATNVLCVYEFLELWRNRKLTKRDFGRNEKYCKQYFFNL